MLKKILLLSTLASALHAADLPSPNPELKDLAEKMKTFAHISETSQKISEKQLPAPWHYLLTQPLMTKGMETYYQGTPVIQTLYAIPNKDNNTFFRAIRMRLPQKKQQPMVLELAFITMNFNELPKKMVGDILHTEIPFGKLLANNHMNTAVTDRSYFAVNCDETLASLTHCKPDSTLYGRTNTIVNAANQHWLAHVVEILPGFKSPS